MQSDGGQLPPVMRLRAVTSPPQTITTTTPGRVKEYIMTNLDRINLSFTAALISDAAEFIGSALEYFPELLNARLSEYDELVNCSAWLRG